MDTHWRSDWSKFLKFLNYPSNVINALSIYHICSLKGNILNLWNVLFLNPISFYTYLRYMTYECQESNQKITKFFYNLLLSETCLCILSSCEVLGWFWSPLRSFFIISLLNCYHLLFKWLEYRSQQNITYETLYDKIGKINL